MEVVLLSDQRSCQGAPAVVVAAAVPDAGRSSAPVESVVRHPVEALEYESTDEHDSEADQHERQDTTESSCARLIDVHGCR
jgi:hypothetical protein